MKRWILSIIIILFAVSYLSFDSSAVGGTWIESGGGWWYENADGTYAKGEYIDGYWLNGSGWYDSSWNGYWDSDSSGWWFQSGSWYPCGQWLKIDGIWYYFNSSGYMAADEWIGNYYLTSDGPMAINTWVGDYYVGSDGAWVPGKAKESTKPTSSSDPNKSTNKTSNDSSNSSNNGSNQNGQSSGNNNSNSGNTKVCLHKYVKQWPIYEHTSYDGKDECYICTECGLIRPAEWKSWNGEVYGTEDDVMFCHKHTDGSPAGSTQFVAMDKSWTKVTLYVCTECGDSYTIREPFTWNCSTMGHRLATEGMGTICTVCGARIGYPKQTAAQSKWK